MVSYGLITKGGILTNAGALLADDCPIPQSRLFCTRWSGKDKAADSTASRKEQGNILELLDMAENFIKVQTNKGWVKRPTERDNYPDYPERAVTESLVNAFIHRDYTISGSEVHVDIFDDRMEIMSPGGMPDGSLVQDLDVMNVPSDRRNGILADVFDRLDYMEREGSGFKKIVGAYAADVSYNPLGLAPKFYSAVGCFVVTLPNLNGHVARSDTQGDTQGDAKAQKRNVDLMLVEWIAADPKVTVKVLAERLKCSVVTVKRHIAKLQNIRYVGHGYSGHWEVV